MSSGCSFRTAAVARRSSGIRLLEFTTPKQPTTVPSATRSGATRGRRPGRMRHDRDRPGEAGGARVVAHVLRMDDERRRVLEHERGEREVRRTRLPQRRDPLVEDAVPEQAADDAVLALHQVEVGVAVPPPDGHSGDEVVEDEVVEDDDTRPLAQRVDDPGMRVRVVPDVVERDIGAARRRLLPPTHDGDVDPLAQRRKEQRAVVGDARLLGRHRAEVGELHASSLAIARSQVTSLAIAFPARP